ncbi:MAG: electron transport complex subunit RsxE [Firmicutes bacterium]|jgi:electron transport complex protein RnfE|nr:electron transport complex subunit RsxE [Bacillota bacterium]
MRQLWRDFREGFIDQTPPFFAAMGLCPALAVTSAVVYGFSMGMAVLAVLLGSNIVVSLIRRWVPAEVRIPVYTVIIATLVTVVDLVLAGTVPAIHRTLGLFIPLIVVNCIILGRAEAFASKHGVTRSIADAFGYALGYTWALLLISAVREILGSGTILGLRVMPAGFVAWKIMLTPPGAFLAMGTIVSVINVIRNRSRSRSAAVKRAQPDTAVPEVA